MPMTNEDLEKFLSETHVAIISTVDAVVDRQCCGRDGIFGPGTQGLGNDRGRRRTTLVISASRRTEHQQQTERWQRGARATGAGWQRDVHEQRRA